MYIPNPPVISHRLTACEWKRIVYFSKSWMLMIIIENVFSNILCVGYVKLFAFFVTNIVRADECRMWVESVRWNWIGVRRFIKRMSYAQLGSVEGGFARKIIRMCREDHEAHFVVGCRVSNGTNGGGWECVLLNVSCIGYVSNCTIGYNVIILCEAFRAKYIYN